MIEGRVKEGKEGEHDVKHAQAEIVVLARGVDSTSTNSKNSNIPDLLRAASALLFV